MSTNDELPCTVSCPKCGADITQQIAAGKHWSEAKCPNCGYTPKQKTKTRRRSQTNPAVIGFLIGAVIGYCTPSLLTLLEGAIIAAKLPGPNVTASSALVGGILGAIIAAKLSGPNVMVKVKLSKADATKLLEHLRYCETDETVTDESAAYHQRARIALVRSLGLDEKASQPAL